MRIRNHMFLARLTTLMLAGCGSGSNAPAATTDELHACEIVPGTEISRIVGASLVASNVDMEQNYGSTAFSQCTHTLDGSPRRVTVQIRRSGTPIGVSRQADADKERKSDDGTGYGIKFAEAIEAGADIGGLGDFAYSFEFGETVYVVAYMDQKVEARAWIAIGKDGKERTLQIGKEIVTQALQQL